jgi:class 3 adenylate cyclase
MGVAGWLRDLGPEQYALAFRDNDIDGEVLCRLTSEDLRELGVSSIGHRRRLLDAITALGTVSPDLVTTARSHDVPPLAEAERRQLTVMFCDLVGSTELAARLDPEDYRDVIGAHQRAVVGVVMSFEGFVAKYMGDGVSVYFGYPRAHDDGPSMPSGPGLARWRRSIVSTSNQLSSKRAWGLPPDWWLSAI